MPFRPIVPPPALTEAAEELARVPPRPVAGPPQRKRARAKAAAKRAHHKVDRTGPNWDQDGDYIVGKGRPPKASRWQKGQSGNPRGPAKREKLTAQEQLEQAFLAPFTATVNGEARLLTMDAFAVHALKNAAVKGSVGAAKTLLDAYTSMVRKVADNQSGPEVEAWEQEVIDRLLKELDLPERPVIRAERAAGQS